MIFIKYVCRVDLRMTQAELEEGDFAIHGEEPYTFAYYNRTYKRIAVGYSHEEGKMMDPEKGTSSGNGSNDGVIMGHDPEADHITSQPISEDRKKED